MPQWHYPLCSGCRRRWRHQPKACEVRPRRFLRCSRCCLCSDFWVLQVPRCHGQVLHDVLIPSAGICQRKPSDGPEFSDLAVVVHNVTVRIFSSSKPYTLNPTCLPLRTSCASFFRSGNSRKHYFKESDECSVVRYSSIACEAFRFQLLVLVVPVDQPRRVPHDPSSCS